MHLFIVVVALLFLLQTGLLVYFVRLRSRSEGSEGHVDTTSAPPRPRIIKCHVKTFKFADGLEITKHSECDGLGLDALTDENAQQLHPVSSLVHVTNETHAVRP